MSQLEQMNCGQGSFSREDAGSCPSIMICEDDVDTHEAHHHPDWDIECCLSPLYLMVSR